MLAGGPHLVSGVGQELSGAAINQTEMHYVTRDSVRCSRTSDFALRPGAQVGPLCAQLGRCAGADDVYST